MKKSLVALAVLAASGAYAQSSVTLFGIVEATTDIGFNRNIDTRSTTNNVNSLGLAIAPTGTVASSARQKNSFRIQDGSDQGSGSSRVGFRGTEDLGGGLKADFLLEMGLRIDDGCTTLSAAGGCDNGGNSANSGGSTFGRNAWGGLSGGFGEVRLGRQVLGSFGVQGNSGSSGASNGLYDASTAGLLPMGNVRFSNAIRYLSPNFGGFTGSLMLAAPETGPSNPTTISSTSLVGSPVPAGSASRRIGVDLALEYANGPAYIGFGYNKRDTGNVTSSTPALGVTTNASPGVVNGYTVGGSYDLGVVKPFINYTRQTTDIFGSTIAATALTNSSNANARALSIGLRAPVGAFTVIAGYGRLNTRTNEVATSTTAGVTTATALSGEAKRDAFQLGGQYALSKRTLIEANYGYSRLRSNGGGSVSNGNLNADGTLATITPASIGASGNRSFDSNDRTSSFNVGLKHSF